MTYRGRVEKGVVVLEAGADLKDGTEVRVEPVPAPQGCDLSRPDLMTSLRDQLLALAGTVEGDYPTDMAENHDHYIRSGPRK